MDNIKERIVKIYTLSDPITNEVRYVGKTITTLKDRFLKHINDSKKHKDYKSN